MQVGVGFWASKTLLSAVELELFTQLGADSMTGEQIEQRLGLHPRATYDFLDTLVALRNSFIWLVLLTVFVVVGGLVTAVLFDRVRYEPVAKALLFLPLAISFVGAGVIWKFMFDYELAGKPQIGTLNGLLQGVGVQPAAFLIDSPGNTIWLIIVGAWIWTGFAMVILSAALKGISPEILEAARVDGATELEVFRRITLPLLSPTIAVVATTMIITAAARPTCARRSRHGWRVVSRRHANPGTTKDSAVMRTRHAAPVISPSLSGPSDEGRRSLTAPGA